MLTNSEDEALNIVLSGGELIKRFEEAKKAIVRRSQQVKYVKELGETTQALVAEVNKELSDKIEQLQQQLSAKEKYSIEEISKLKKELEILKSPKKPRKKQIRKHKKRG